MSLESFQQNFCQYFPKCGGCDLLNLSEVKYQEYKKNSLIGLAKNKKILIPENIDWQWIEAGSRRRIILQINQDNRIGFFEKKSKNVIEIDSCYVAKKVLSEAIILVKDFLQSQPKNFYQQAIITVFDDSIDIVFLVNKPPILKVLNQIINFAKKNSINISYKIKDEVFPVVLLKQNSITVDNFKLDLDFDIFLQATKSGLDVIINQIKKTIFDNQKIKKVVDLYSGFGVYSFAIQEKIKLVHSFEGNISMVEMIKKNANFYQVSNKIKSFNRDLFFNPVSKDELENFDLAIINPPRNGALPQIKEIAKSSIKNVVYVSCNPDSFFNDAKILVNENFKIKNIIALDQFYGSSHLELITNFTKNETK
jgi:23S rRNA (uracil1939-C5)-methyltransferase